MAVFDFLKPPKRGAPASQIEQLEQQLVRVRTERSDLEKTLDGHSQRRAQLLLADVSEENILETDRQADLSRLRLERLEVAEIALIEQLDAARDGLDRSKRAAQLESAAGAIESKVAALDAAIGALGRAFNDLTGAIPVESGVQKDADTMLRPASPEDIARAIMASGLYAAAPDVFEMVQPRTRTARPAAVERVLNVSIANRDGVLTRFIPGLRGEEAIIPPTPEAAQEIIVKPLRAQAARLRDSDAMKEAAE